MTSTETTPIMTWLSRNRQANRVRYDLVAWQFDVEGALAADQPELAWWARSQLIAAGIDQYLTTSGIPVPLVTDEVDRVCAALALLAQVNPDLARDLRELLTRPAPATRDGIADDVTEARRFLATRMSVRAAASRGEAMRAWADGVRVLREVALGMGLAQSDGWYIPDAESVEQELGWYQQVMDVAGEQS